MTHRDGAAVDSELSLVALPEHTLVGWVRNPLYRRDPAQQRTILLAARLDGPTPAIAGLVGIGYIDARGLTGGAYRAGDAWMTASEAALREAGVFTRMDMDEATFPSDMPMPHAAFYFGWYRPDLGGPMARPGFRFVPGAVAYHLHSGSAARVRRADLGWVGPLLARGAAATMGAVSEPYLGGTPDLGEFTRRLLAGRTFGESAYAASPYLSWMTTVIGDPLYAPFHGGRFDAALARPGHERWRTLREVILATEAGEFNSALERCRAREDQPLFVELAARAHQRAGHPAAALAATRRLAEITPDAFTALRTWRQVGQWLARPGRAEGPQPALEAYLAALHAHPGSPHALPIYREALGLARSMRSTATEVALWEALAAHFPQRAVGRLAQGELALRGLRRGAKLPGVSVPRVPGPPELDGAKLAPVWAATPAKLGLPFGSGPVEEACRAEVTLARDDRALYVVARWPHVQTWAGRITDREDRFEMTLSPARNLQRPVVIRVERNAPDGPLPPGISVATACADLEDALDCEVNGWVVRVTIPFEALGVDPPRKDSVWAANFVQRGRTLKFPFRLVPWFMSWAAPDANPLAPECAGYLMFQ